MMMARRYFAWRMVAEAEERSRRKQERHKLQVRRKELADITRMSNTHFVQRYRLNKEAFKYLCTILKECTELKRSQRVSLENKVLCALLFYANGDYQRVVGLANHFSQEAISRYVHEVTTALNHPNIVLHFIKFPSTREARNHMKQIFYNLYGIPGVVGCIDGSHFRIFHPPKAEEHLYYCRKHYHSLNVQMVADHKGKIISMNAKFGGATHDAFVWENSDLNTYMQSLHQNGEVVWLLGDSGYPQRPWLMTPYSHPQPQPGTAAERYNFVHSRARVIIENTFGRLKNRWRCVCKDRVLHYKPEKCAKIIMACSVLHNLAIDFRVPEPAEETIIDNNEEFHREETSHTHDDQSLLILGRHMRDRVASSIH